MGTTFRIKKNRRHKNGSKYTLKSGTTYRIHTDENGKQTLTIHRYRKLVKNVGDGKAYK